MAAIWKPRLFVFAGLHDKPAVKKLAKLTGLTQFDVVGRLLAFWLEAQIRCDARGLIAGKREGWVDDLVDHPGFAVAMEKAGWLTIGTTDLFVPKVDKFISKAAVRRIERSMARQGAREIGRTQPSVRHAGDMMVTTGDKPESVPVVRAPKVAAKKADPARKPKQADVTDARFWRFWRAYPKKYNQPLAYEKWAELNPDDALVEKILAAVAEQIDSPQWRKDDGQFIPAPANWLRGRQWENQLEPLPGGRLHAGARVQPAAGEFGEAAGRRVIVAGDDGPPAPAPAQPETPRASLFD